MVITFKTFITKYYYRASKSCINVKNLIKLSNNKNSVKLNITKFGLTSGLTGHQTHGVSGNYGFRSRRSTSDLLSYFFKIWSSIIEKYNESRTVTFDISKPFDQFCYVVFMNKKFTNSIEKIMIFKDLQKPSTLLSH